jgi:uncharacterized protein (TIGR02246 family)
MRPWVLPHLTLILMLPSSPLVAEEPAVPSTDETAVRAVVRKYVEAREASDSKAIEALFTEDADQLVSDGTWRRGRDTLVRGMLESSRRNPARRTIDVESVRLLSPEVALVDGRYVQKGADGGRDREMWTAITLKPVFRTSRVEYLRISDSLAQSLGSSSLRPEGPGELSPG